MRRLALGNNIRLSKAFFEADAENNLQRLWTQRWTAEIVLGMKAMKPMAAESPINANIISKSNSGDEQSRSVAAQNNLWRATLVLQDILNDSTKLEDTLIAANELGVGGRNLDSESKQPKHRIQTLDFGKNFLDMLGQIERLKSGHPEHIDEDLCHSKAAPATDFTDRLTSEQRFEHLSSAGGVRDYDESNSDTATQLL